MQYALCTCTVETSTHTHRDTTYHRRFNCVCVTSGSCTHITCTHMYTNKMDAINPSLTHTVHVHGGNVCHTHTHRHDIHTCTNHYVLQTVAVSVSSGSCTHITYTHIYTHKLDVRHHRL
jgi:hypothetical protein